MPDIDSCPGFSPARFRALRRDLPGQVTAAELDRMAGAGAGNTRRWESGTCRPAPRYIPVYAQALGVHPNAMFDLAEGEEELVHLRLWAGLTRYQLGAKTRFGSSACRTLEIGSIPQSWGTRSWKRLATALSVTEENVRQAWRRTHDRNAWPE